MNRLRLSIVIAFVVSSSSYAGNPASPGAPVDLTFEERVRAQEAIERVRHAHQTGDDRSFEDAVPRAALERKVLTYLKESAALESIWHTPVTAAALQAEWRRVRAGSRMPERLREIEEALEGDPVLFQECYLRPLLVSRLVRRYQAAGERALEWSEWWPTVEGAMDASAVATVAVAAAPAHTGGRSSDCILPDTWDNGSLGSAPDGRIGHSSIWTGTEMIVWGGYDGASRTNSGWRYDPLIDEWSEISPVGAPPSMESPVAVWTGTEMIVWGGYTYPAMQVGGRYDPRSDTWRPMSQAGAPSPRYAASAVWTGSEMVLFGGWSGNDVVNDGGRYNPVTDSWTTLPGTGAPAPRRWHTALWTGSRMIIFGGLGRASQPVQGGASYDPSTGDWTPLTAHGAPQAPFGHSAIWTGQEMIVWGGDPDSLGPPTDPGGRYDPLADRWRPLTSVAAPMARQRHAAVWTGDRMVVWGGANKHWGPIGRGAAYDPVADRWTAISSADEPEARGGVSIAWTGSEVLVWGGHRNEYLPHGGGRYHPGGDTWAPMNTGPGPEGRLFERAVWSGNEMFFSGALAYDPAADSWRSLSASGAPSITYSPLVFWTGSRLLVWGAGPPTTGPGTGGLYDPLSDQWAPISRSGAPSSSDAGVWTGTTLIVFGGAGAVAGGIYDEGTDTWADLTGEGAPDVVSPVAVWTGSEVIIWGIHYEPRGTNPSGRGGRYDPLGDRWAPVSTLNAPSARLRPTVVWTGQEMIVWGGWRWDAEDTGGRYDPVSDTWRPTSTIDVPTRRHQHSAFWTGKELLIWGGDRHDQVFDSGGLYDPVADRWRATTRDYAPTGRFWHAAAWTGEMMIVWGGMSEVVGSGVILKSGGRYFPYGRSRDLDGDGYGTCEADCDDSDAAVHPGAAEIPGNRVDEDCSGAAACDAGAAWATHGTFVGCVVDACRDAVKEGRLSREQCQAAVTGAAGSGVGRR